MSQRHERPEPEPEVVALAPEVRPVAGELRHLAARSVGGGRVDSLAVLVLRLVRRLWGPALVFGVAWLALVGDLDDPDLIEINSVGGFLRALLSPFVGLALALAFRVIASVLGTVAAFPQALAEHRRTNRGPWGAARNPGDLWVLTTAYRSLRFTSAARDVAAGQLGSLGRGLLLADRAVGLLVPVGVVALVAAVVVAA